MRHRNNKFFSKLLCILIIICVFMTSSISISFATSDSSSQNVLLSILTLSNSQRNSFSAFILSNIDKMTLSERVAEVKKTYLPACSITDVQTLLEQYDSYTVQNKDALKLFIMGGIPTNTVIGSVNNYKNIAAFVNNEITDNETGTVNGQTNVGVALLLKVLSTADKYVGYVAHDSTSDNGAKIHFSMPNSNTVDNLMSSVMNMLDSLNIKISSRPESSQILKLLGYTEDGINNIYNYAEEIPYFKRALIHYDAKIYDGTNYSFLYGDVDGNGKIAIEDALMALQAASERITLTDSQKVLADVNFDGKLTVIDALKILQFSMGRIVNF